MKGRPYASQQMVLISAHQFEPTNTCWLSCYLGADIRWVL